MSVKPKLPIDVQTTVLPPDGKGRAPDPKDAPASEASHIVAKWMDEILRIPGTNIRIGLDPIIGLFPGVGDFLASSVGLVLVTEGVRSRLPISVLMRMGSNVLINTVVSSVPIAGDFFSVWFKSNKRNLALLNRWKTGDQSVKRGSRLFMVVFIGLWLAVLAFWAFVWLSIAGFLYKMGQNLATGG